MKVRKLALADATMERSAGQEDEIYTGNLVDERDGGPVTIGYGRWGAGSSLTQTMAVDDIMIVLEGRLSATSDADTVTAGPGEIVYMPKGRKVTIRAHEADAVTAYVTYPHWREAEGAGAISGGQFEMDSAPIKAMRSLRRFGRLKIR